MTVVQSQRAGCLLVQAQNALLPKSFVGWTARTPWTAPELSALFPTSGQGLRARTAWTGTSSSAYVKRWQKKNVIDVCAPSLATLYFFISKELQSRAGGRSILRRARRHTGATGFRHSPADVTAAVIRGTAIPLQRPIDRTVVPVRVARCHPFRPNSRAPTPVYCSPGAWANAAPV